MDLGSYGVARVPDGFTVVLKTGDDTFQYSSPLWTDRSTVLNEGSDPSSAGNAKYRKFNSQQLDAVMFCFGSLDNCLNPTSPRPSPAPPTSLTGSIARKALTTPPSWKRCELRRRRPGWPTGLRDAAPRKYGIFSSCLLPSR